MKTLSKICIEGIKNLCKLSKCQHDNAKQSNVEMLGHPSTLAHQPTMLVQVTQIMSGISTNL